MSSTHQWRGRLASSAMLIVAAVVAALALTPAASFAHPGHDHGLSSATGRMPGVPDYQKIGGVVSRFDAESREYILRRPGEPAVSAHVESDIRPNSEGLAANGGYSSLPSGEIQPSCATSGHRIVVVNAFDAGTKTPDAGDALIRSLVKRMNWKFAQQSQLSSNPDRTLQMKVDCASGVTTVTDVAVPFGYKGKGVDTTDGDIGVLDTINYVEEKLGAPEGANAVKYLIFNDKSRSGFVGVGYKNSDATKSSSNVNLQYTSSALIARNPEHTTDGKDSWESTIPIHELLHVMGAAFNYETESGEWITAPYATTGSHCVDGVDILCYSDKGTSPDGSYSESRCPAWAGYESAERVPIDCKFDTFFDAETEPGEWLSKWWNVGGPENPFLIHTPETPPVATAPQAFTTPADYEAYSATLKGIINPGGVATTYKFEYGTTTSYGSSVPASPGSAGAGIEDVEVSAAIAVKPETTYHYRVVATNSKGTLYGNDETVTTSFWEAQAIEGPTSSNGRGELRDVSCSSSLHCVAVGTNTKGASLAEQWDGSDWSVMTSANPSGNHLDRVSCSSANFCMATGLAGTTLFSERWDGSSWSTVSMPAPVGAKNPVITGISCTSSMACVAVGRYSGPKGYPFETKTLTERWNGSEWAIDSSPYMEGSAFNELTGVSCAASNSCIAVGFTVKTTTSEPLVGKWDGSKWSAQAVPAPPGGSGTLSSVSCPVTNFCMTVGSGSSAFAASWDGSAWKTQGSGLQTSLSVSCATQTSCVLVGNQTGRNWNGSEWTVQNPSSPPNGTNAKVLRNSCPRPSLCIGVGLYTGQAFFNQGTRPFATRLTPTPHIKLRAEEYPTSVTSTQSGSHVFKTEKGSNLSCSTAKATGTMSAASSVLALTPSYEGCSLFGIKATVTTNSCRYLLISTNDKAPYTGSLDVACSKAGDEIKVATSICTLSIPPQTGLGSVALSNTGKKSRGRTITTALSLSGVKYTESVVPGGGCPAAGTHNGGTYAGTSVISGYNTEAEHPVGVYLANEQVMIPPLLEAEKYSAVVDATLQAATTMGISMPGGEFPTSFTCSSTGTGQGLLTAASKELSLKFKKWTGCNWGGAFDISMNGCSFALNPLVGELPYASGSLGIACPKEAEITFTMMSGGCKVGIPAQTGLGSVKTENLGAGASRTVKASIAVKGLKYTQTGGGFCNSPGTHEDGSLNGTWNLGGYQFAGEQWVEGELKYIKGSQQGLWVE